MLRHGNKHSNIDGLSISDMKIIVYSMRNCPWCVKLKQFLAKNKIKFEELDVNRDKRALLEMIQKTGDTSVPVIEIGKKIIKGFDEDEIKKALKIKS